MGIEDDYIFVEGNRYISTKRAADVTGYTSDYIGQLAREGKIRSKKIGKIRFVEDGELKNYTIESDRKKTVTQKLVKIAPSDSKTGDAEKSIRKAVEEIIGGQRLYSGASHYSTSYSASGIGAVMAGESDEVAHNDTATPATDETSIIIDEVGEVDNPDAHSPFVFKDADTQVKEHERHKMSLPMIAERAGALAITVLIVFGPYLARESGLWQDITDTVSVAYDSVIFDSENLALAVYEKVEDDGWLGLVFDSLQNSEMGLRDAVATSIYGYMKAGSAIENIPDFVAGDIRDSDGSVYDRMLSSVRSVFWSIFDGLQK